MNFPVHGNSHFSGHDVVLRVGVMVGINAEKVLVGFAEHLRVNRTESSVWAGVTEIKGKLSSLDLDGEGIRGRGWEINVGPSLDSEDTQRQNLGSHQKKCTPDHGLRTAGKILHFVAGFGVG